MTTMHCVLSHCSSVPVSIKNRLTVFVPCTFAVHGSRMSASRLTLRLLPVQSQAEAHYRGSRHAKKLKSQENKAKLSVNAEANGSSSGVACPAHPVTLNSSPHQHTGWFDFLFPMCCFYAVSFFFLHLLPLPELVSSFTSSPPLKPFLLPPSSSSLPSGRAGSEPPPSSPPSALPAPGLSSVSASSSSTPPHLPSAPPAPQEAPLLAESEEEKAKKLLYCSLCKVAVNSLSQLEAHNAGEGGAGPSAHDDDIRFMYMKRTIGSNVFTW